MITLFMLLLVLLICASWFLKKRKEIFTTEVQDSRFGREEVSLLNTKPLLPIAVTLVIGIILSLVQPFTYERVDAGNVGVKVNLTGHERGISDIEYKTGWVWYNTWTEELYQFPVYQQHIEYDDQTVILKGGFKTTIQPTFNYSLKKEMVTSMFGELRLTLKEIEQGWLKTAIISSVNDVANRWEVDEIFNDREKFENEIIAECNERVGMWFNVSLLRTNIVPPPSIEKAIEDQVKAVKETQAKQQQVAVTIANGEIMIAQARADSAKAVISAKGIAEAKLIEAKAEAEAIRIKQREITGTYNDYIRAKNWNGKLPTYQGSGGSFLFDTRNN